VHTIEHYAGLAKAIRGGYVPSLDERAHGLILRRPLGVVVAIVPWNFPTTLLANKLGPALLAGNTVVAKPAETTPLTTLRIAELMHEAGVPAGAFNVITGRGSELGPPLVRHPLVRKVAFTGSTPVGREVMALAAEGTKRLTLELGGSDPMIVCADADIDAAVSAASVGRFFNCGQACLAVKRLYVEEPVADEVVEKLVAKAGRLRVGPGTAEGVTLGPLHTAGQREAIEEQVADALERSSAAGSCSTAAAGPRASPTTPASSTSRRWCASRRAMPESPPRRSSGRPCRSGACPGSRRRSSWPTTRPSGSAPRSSRATSTPPPSPPSA
jgi:succinate-semialdehyde dehydrogenase/glutarate-semialdehyde dehydrogenase